MKNTHSKFLIILFALSLICGGQKASAQAGAVPDIFPTAGNVPQQNQPLIPVGGNTPAGSPNPSANDKYLIKNPLSKTTTLSQLLLNVVSIVRILLIMAAVLYLLYAGFQFVTARGQAAKIVKARNALLWGCVGIALILAAQVIITTLQNTVNGILSS